MSDEASRCHQTRRRDGGCYRSHVSDTRLDVMLDAQRRYAARSSRKKVVEIVWLDT